MTNSISNNFGQTIASIKTITQLLANYNAMYNAMYNAKSKILNFATTKIFLN